MSKGNSYAFHNPSDVDMVYGTYKVGEYRKNGKEASYVGEEHISSMTSAPLNSFGLNPSAYTIIKTAQFVTKIYLD